MNWIADYVWWVWVPIIIFVAGFGWVVFFGAPYVPTLEKQRRAALKLLGLKPGQNFVDLGSGDGSMLVLAARAGLKVTGYELNPVLAAVSWFRTRRYRKQVRVVWGSFWRADLSQTDGIYVFLIDHFMGRLDKLITKQPHKKLRLVSHAFKIPGRKVVRRSQAHLLYIYSAKSD